MTDVGPSGRVDNWREARAKGLDSRAMLAGHDCHSFFAAIGDRVCTVSTPTNVNKFRAILIA